MYDDIDLNIKKTYDWCVRVFSRVENRLGVSIKFHKDEGQVEAGQIFLFNHFARFETVIPQYLIYREVQAYCRAVAASELFQGNDRLAKFLFGVGAVPNDLPGLLPFLAAEILRGRKIVIFPEGGMVKDRRVLDEGGRYSVFSPTALARRKHHKGAAVVALTLEVFKTRIRSLEQKGDAARLERWASSLELAGVDELVAAAHKPTLIVPANITFYPIRAAENMLKKGVELFASGLTERFAEELLIEGNILLRDTDMDVRFAETIAPRPFRSWWERKFIDQLFLRLVSLDELFELNNRSERWIDSLFTTFLTRETRRLRDAYMHRIYSGVTVNLSHLAAQVIDQYVDAGRTEVPFDLFNKALYLAIKYVQNADAVNLHECLINPEDYVATSRGHVRGLDEFWATGEASGLVRMDHGHYVFLPKLRDEHGFDEIRLENTVAVYANEVAPVAPAMAAITRAVTDAQKIDAAAVARLRFDDECRMHEWSKQFYTQERHEDINGQETATESGAPFLLLPGASNDLGVVLVHGFLASPAEVRGLGETLVDEGHPVVGVRLAGHGTSPWDLRDRSWQDWLDSVNRGYAIMAALAKRVCVVGFSTGGSLALICAAARPPGLAGVVAVSAPVHFRNRNLVFVPLVHGVNKLAEWVPNMEGVKPFRLNDSEHPAINYRNMPIRGLYELRLVVDALRRQLTEITCPVGLIQATGDQVVDPKSADTIFKGIGSIDKAVRMIDANRHGIVTENIGGTHDTVVSYLGAIRDGCRLADSLDPAATANLVDS